jgi:hypothetical protein
MVGDVLKGKEYPSSNLRKYLRIKYLNTTNAELRLREVHISEIPQQRVESRMGIQSLSGTRKSPGWIT